MSDRSSASTGRPDGTTGRGLTALCVAAIVVFGVAIFSRTLFLDRIPSFPDTRDLYYPWAVWLAQEGSAGRWLSWCHDLACGFPLWSNGQSGAFYPFSLLYLLPLRTSWLLMFVTLLHHLIGAVGMFTLARRLSLGRAAATVSAVLFSFSGFTWAHHLHYVFALAMAWMPWCALSMLAWVRRRASWGLVVAALTLAFAAVSHPQMPIFLAAFALAMLWAAPRLPEIDGAQATRWPAQFGLFLVPVVIAGLFAAIQVVPMFELLRAGAGEERSGYEFLTAFSLPPWHLVTMLLPHYFGTENGAYFGAWNFVEMCGYIGGVALVLAIVVRPPGDALRKVRGRLWFVAIAAAILAFGSHTPLYDLLQHVPLFNRFRAPARWLSVWTGVGALLVGIAVHTVADRRWGARSRRRVALVLLALAVACTLVVTTLVYIAVTDVAAPGDLGRAVERLRRVVEGPLFPLRLSDLIRLGLASVLVCSVLLWSATGRLSRRSAAVAVGVVLALQVAHFAWTCFPVEPVAEELNWSPAVVRGIEAHRGQGRVLRYFTRKPNRRKLSVNLNVAHGIPVAAISDTVTPPVEVLRSELEAAAIAPETAAAFGAEIVLTDVPAAELPAGLELLRRVVVESGEPPVGIYRNPRFRGLAWTGEEMPRTLRPPPDAQPRPPRVREWRGNRITLEIPGGPRCALVVAVSRLPGWSATVNGRRAPIEAANEVFMGVSLPAEASVVELRYRPAGFRSGLAIFGLGVALMGIVIWLSRRRDTGAGASQIPRGEESDR
ncbi:MAG: YfhO family protein [Armatimonadota bacterium]